MGLSALAEHLRGTKEAIIHRWETAVREARRRLWRALEDSGQAAAAHFHAEALAERQRLEAALAIANERKDRFLALLSHELRNPLTVVQNSIHLLSRRISGQPELMQPLS